MKTEQSARPELTRRFGANISLPFGKRLRSTRLLLLFLLAVFALGACATDLNPEGGWSGIAQEDDFLYIGSKDGRVVRVNSNTSTLDRTWVFPPNSEDDLGEIYGTPQVSAGVIYGSAFRCRGNDCSGSVYAVDIATGRSAWAQGVVEYDTRLVGSVGVGDTTLAVGTAAIGGNETPRGFLMGLDFTTDFEEDLENQVINREKWRLPVDGAIWGGVTVVDDVAYFGTLQGTLYAVSLADDPAFDNNPVNRIQWQFKTGGAIVGTPNVTDTNVFVGDFENDVYALNIESRRSNPNSSVLNASTEWTFETDGWVWAQPLLHNGVVYVVSLPGKVYALDADTGQRMWQQPAEVGEEIVAQPTLLDRSSGMALAVASGEGDITLVELTGQVRGKFDTDGRGMKSSPVVVGEVLFTHTDSGQLRQYQAGSLALLNCIEAKGEGKGC